MEFDDDTPLSPNKALVRATASLVLAPEDAGWDGSSGAVSVAGVIHRLGPGLEMRYRAGQRVAVIGDVGADGMARVSAEHIAPVPDDANDEEACFAGAAARALAAIGGLGCRLGDAIAVLGDGLGGLLAAELLDLSSLRAIVLDRNPARRDLARFVGAELALEPASEPAVGTVMAATSGRGCDGVLVAIARPSPRDVALAAGVAADGAAIQLMARPPDTFAGDVLGDRGLTLRTAPPVTVGEGRRLAAAARLMSRRRDRRLHVEQFIAGRFTADRVAEAAACAQTSGLGAVLRYPERPRERKLRVRVPAHVSPAEGPAKAKFSLGLIAGSAAIAERMAPYLPGTEVAARQSFAVEGAAGGTVATGMGFAGPECATGDILDDPAIQAVIIATTGAAATVAAALRSGKHVLAAAPLAADREGLQTVAGVRRGGGAFLLLANPWRHAPKTRAAMADLTAHPGPRNVVVRFGAGNEVAVAWAMDAAAALSIGRIATVFAAATTGHGGAPGGLSALVTFTDGGLATLVAVDDQPGATIELTAPSGFRRAWHLAGPERGAAMLADLFQVAVTSGGPSPVDEQAQIEACGAALAVYESLRRGSPVAL